MPESVHTPPSPPRNAGPADGAPGDRATLSERVLLAMFRAFPPRYTIFKEAAPRPAEEYADECRFPFWRYFGRSAELLAGRDVLDLGCGYGGRTVRFKEVGARSVVGVEVTGGMVDTAGRFAAERGVENMTFAVGAGEALPLDDASVDVVVMNDVFEHVVSPADVLRECLRVLRPGGRAAIVFPPYYHVTGGSHLDGYATRIPALNVVFSSKSLRAASRRLMEEQGRPWRRFLRDEPTDKLWNLNGLTVRGFDRLSAECGLEREQVWYLGHWDRRLLDSGRPPLARRPLFAILEAMARIPLVRELSCLRICALLRKPDAT